MNGRKMKILMLGFMRITQYLIKLIAKLLEYKHLKIKNYDYTNSNKALDIVDAYQKQLFIR